jgi:predicted amidohydrolase
MLNVTVYQPSGSLDYQKNLKFLIEQIKTQSSKLLIFPELYITGYVIRDELFKYHLNMDCEDFKLIKNAVEKYDKIVIFGYPEEYNHQYYNSAALISKDLTATVRKIYLPDFGPFEEKKYFSGSNDINVYDTEFGKIGIHICYDIFFPEISKIQALKGADILVNVSASPVTSRFYFENLMVSRAIENTVFYIYNNWAGTQRSLVFWGGSAIIGPQGQVLVKAPYFEPYVMNYKIDLKDLKIARRFRPTMKDTKRELLKGF